MLKNVSSHLFKLGPTICCAFAGLWMMLSAPAAEKISHSGFQNFRRYPQTGPEQWPHFGALAPLRLPFDMFITFTKKNRPKYLTNRTTFHWSTKISQLKFYYCVHQQKLLTRPVAKSARSEAIYFWVCRLETPPCKQPSLSLLAQKPSICESVDWRRENVANLTWLLFVCSLQSTNTPGGKLNMDVVPLAVWWSSVVVDSFVFDHLNWR